MEIMVTTSQEMRKEILEKYPGFDLKFLNDHLGEFIPETAANQPSPGLPQLSPIPEGGSQEEDESPAQPQVTTTTAEDIVDLVVGQVVGELSAAEERGLSLRQGC